MTKSQSWPLPVPTETPTPLALLTYKMQVLALLLIALIALLSPCEGFAPRSFGAVGKSLASAKSLTLQAKPKPATEEEQAKYWQGDWVCADCGYIYDRDIDGRGLYFEQQQRGFICPQCSAPRKRYAKAVGDQWGVTRDGGDFPIYAWTLVGLVATTYYALVVVPTL